MRLTTGINDATYTRLLQYLRHQSQQRCDLWAADLLSELTAEPAPGQSCELRRDRALQSRLWMATRVSPD